MYRIASIIAWSRECVNAIHLMLIIPIGSTTHHRHSCSCEVKSTDQQKHLSLSDIENCQNTSAKNYHPIKRK